MVVLWVLGGGTRQVEHDSAHERSGHVPENTTHMPVWMVVTHATLALLVIGLWIVYMASPDRYDMTPGFSLAMLVLVAITGFVMLRNWLIDRRELGEDRRFRDDIPAEQKFPAAGVFVHGAAGVVMLVLVALVTFGVGVD